MQKILSILVVAVVATVGLSISATSAHADDKQPKTKVYDFSGDTIEGDLIRPEGTTVDARDFAKHASLIRIRKDFIPEILKSAEDL